MLKDFKGFILRGNVVDLAVGVVLGAAFGAVVTSFVKDVLTPALSLISLPDFSTASVKAGDAKILYGVFLNTLISFIMIAAAVFFLVVRPVNKLMAKRRTEPDVESTTKECPHCMSHIPLAASVCAFCTRETAAA